MKRTLHIEDLKIILQIFIPPNYSLSINGSLQEKNFFNDFILLHPPQSSPKEAIKVHLLLPGWSSFDHSQYDYVINFSKQTIFSSYERQKFYYINNPDNTIRWVFSKDLERPTFLNFYNSNSFKAKIFSRLSKIIFALKSSRLISSGYFTIHFRKDLEIKEYLKGLPYDNYSIFTGTVGVNRKILIETNKDNKTNAFIKMPISNASKKLVNNEIQTLEDLNTHTFESFGFPKTLKNRCEKIGVLENIKPKKTTTKVLFKGIHAKVLDEIYLKTINHRKLKETFFIEKIKENLDKIDGENCLKFSKKIQENLNSLFAQLNLEAEIPMSKTHGDFTPWNMYVNQDKLFIYDWELSLKEAPLLFDLFHFILQSQIMIFKGDFHKVNCEIEKALELYEVRQLCEKYKIDIKQHFLLYLLYNISYYMPLYQAQKERHIQIFWQLEVWCKALDYFNFKSYNKNFRTSFISRLFENLQDESYALLKHKGVSVYEDSYCDLDLLITENTLQKITHFMDEDASIRKINWSKKSYMTTAELFFQDGSFLSLDLIREFKRKNIIYLDHNELLEQTHKDSEGIKVPAFHHDFEYTYLFYILNHSNIPSSHLVFYKKLPEKERNGIKKYISAKYDLVINKFDELFDYNKKTRTQILKQIKKHHWNKGREFIYNKIKYFFDTTGRLKKKQGKIVTFSGVDGAGKTTILYEIKNQIFEKYKRKCVVLRHRPSVLPILSAWKYGKKEAEKKSMKQLPRTGQNTGKLKSLFRFSYYYIDYVLGQLYISFKYKFRGYIVLYDRYYFDFINDAKRSNIVIDKKITKSLYRFINKPDLNIFLYAPAQVILERKQELKQEDIEILTKNYIELFEDFEGKYKNSQYRCIQNIEIDETLNKINKYLGDIL